MRTVYKYPLSLDREQTLKIPAGSNIISAQFQTGTLCVWAEVETVYPFEMRTVWIIGTGHELPPVQRAPRYISTVQQLGGALVWHIYESKP